MVADVTQRHTSAGARLQMALRQACGEGQRGVRLHVVPLDAHIAPIGDLLARGQSKTQHKAGGAPQSGACEEQRA